MFFLYRWPFSELHSSLIRVWRIWSACVVIFWWFCHDSIKLEFEGRNGWGFNVSSGKLLHAIIVDGMNILC